MEYNSARAQMQMPEYGRAIQQMAEFLLTIEDPEKRLAHAEYIVDVMAILNPNAKLEEGYRHKLWDHLYFLTGFRLDQTGPFEKPKPEEVFAKPERLAYPQHKIGRRHLGHNLEVLLQKALSDEDPEKKQGYAQHLGYYMKLAYATWHKEPVHDEAIAKELRDLSGGEMNYEPGGYRVHVDRNSPAGNNNFKQERAMNKKNYKARGSYGAQQGGGQVQSPGQGNFKKKFNRNNRPKLG